MSEVQTDDLDYEQALKEVKRVVKYVTGKTIIVLNSSFKTDFIIIAKTMLKLELSLQNQIDND